MKHLNGSKIYPFKKRCKISSELIYQNPISLVTNSLETISLENFLNQLKMLV